MERHNVSRLVGAPPGYVGYDEGGQLTEAVRRKSYSVVVLDEIEKAHPEVFNILLQILEDGHLTDAKGRRVDFRNTVIIMTSNVGAQQLQRDTSIGFRAGGSEAAQANADYERMKDKVLSELKNTFRPEFLNRIDATVVFRQLTREEIREIVDLLLARIKAQLAGQEMELQVTDAAKDAIIAKGYDSAYGARPLRREIQNQIEDPLAERMLQAAFEAGDTIVVDADAEGTLTIERAAPPAKRQAAKAGR
jgi:ATP-dependent Clp protease ATP-binding subunit ClpC